MSNEPEQTDADDANELDEVETDGGHADEPIAPTSGGEEREETDEELEPSGKDEVSVADTIDESGNEPTDEQGTGSEDEPEPSDQAETDGDEDEDEEEDDGIAEADPDLGDEESEADDSETSERDSEPELTVPELDDVSDQGVEWLAGLFERMNLEAEAEITEENGEPRVNITGKDADRLLGVGKLGPKAIEGIETLMQSVFSEDDSARDLYVDVEGKRAARKEMLQRVAGEMADRAVELHKSITVSGLNSTERRIIHRRLRDYDGVDTESVGDGIFRRLKIEPTG